MSSSSIDPDGEQDPNYLTLPDTLRKLIDAAFYSALSTDTDPDPRPTRDEPLRKRRRIADQIPQSAVLQPGGFIIEDNGIEPGGFLIDDAPAMGGFIPPSPPPPPPQLTQIPLSLVPAALARLNLAPDDEDVLAVFHNAASGWTDARQSSRGQTEGLVSRKDFRAVCAVLLDSDSPPSFPSHSSISATPIGEGGGFIMEDEREEGGFILPTTSSAASERSVSRNPDFIFDDSGEESDAYQEPDSNPEYDDNSADEYFEGPRPPRPSKSSRKPRKALSSDEEMEVSSHKPKPLSSGQTKESRLAFGLFFPDVADDKLDEQRIMIRDIIRVASLLKEKIKAEEITEMLTAFSTSPDGSMSLADFERMMVVAGMV